MATQSEWEAVERRLLEALPDWKQPEQVEKYCTWLRGFGIEPQPESKTEYCTDEAVAHVNVEAFIAQHRNA